MPTVKYRAPHALTPYLSGSLPFPLAIVCFPYWECATVLRMKLVGRRALVEFEGPLMAKRRLSLWYREVAAANWRSMSDVRAAHQRAEVVQADRIRIEFAAQSVFVEAAISFPVALVYIERVGLVPTPSQ